MTDRLALLFAHLVAAIACFFAGWFAVTQAPRTIPLRDEWPLFADRMARSGFTEWCWAHLHEHRYPLGKAIWSAAIELDGGRFHIGHLTTVGLLTAASVLFIWTARGVRGRAHPADALFPVLLLHLGHWFNLLMSFQLTFALLAYGLAGWLWTVNRVARGGGVGWAVAAGCYGAVVVQSGGFGVVFTPMLAGWSLVQARAGWTARRATAIVLATFALSAAGYTTWVLVTAPASPAKPTGVATFLDAVGGYLSVGLGAWAVSPSIGVRWLAGLSAVAVVLAAMIALARGWQGPARLAVFVALAGGGAVAAAVAYARGDGRLPWYVTPSATELAVAWLAIAARPAVGWRVGALGIGLAGAVAWVNVSDSLHEGFAARSVAHEMQADLDAGTSPLFLAGQYGGCLQIFHWNSTADFARECQRYGLAGFATLQPDPTFRVEPTAVRVPLVFECPDEEFRMSPRRVAFGDAPPNTIGVRLLVRSNVPAGRHRVRLYWHDGTAVRSVVAYAPALGTPTDGFPLALPLSGRAVGVVLMADGIVQPFSVEAVEWMIAN